MSGEETYNTLKMNDKTAGSYGKELAFTVKVGLGGFLLAVFSVMYLFSGFPLGVSGQWVWKKFPEVSLSDWELPVAVFFVVVCLAGLAKLERLGKLGLGGLMLGVFILALAEQVAMSYLTPSGFDDAYPSIALPRANAYFERANAIGNLREYLDRYEEELSKPGVQVQLSTHPPGPVLFFWGWLKLSESRAVRKVVRFAVRLLSRTGEEGAVEVVGALRSFSRNEQVAIWGSALTLKFLSALAVIPIFLGCLYLGGRELGLWASVFYVGCPANYLFSPLMDQLLLFLVAMTFLGAANGKWWGAVLAGFSLFMGLFFSLVFVAVGAVVGLLWLFRFKLSSQLGVLCGLCTLSVVLLTAVFCLAGIDLPGIWRMCYEKNRLFNQITGRSYLAWMVVNPLDFILCAGPVLVVLLVASAREREAVALAVGCVLLFLNFSGANRGEVARLWMPFLAFVCSSLPERLRGKKTEMILLASTNFGVSLLFRATLDSLSLYSVG